MDLSPAPERSSNEGERERAWPLRIASWLGPSRGVVRAAMTPQPYNGRRLAADILACAAPRAADAEANRAAAALQSRYLSSGTEARLAILRAVANLSPLDSSTGARLSELLDSARMRVLKRFNGLEGGLAFLLEMRADLLAGAAEEPAFDLLEQDLGSLFSTWFDVGFLELRPLTWDSPASLLEKLFRYEAVHAIASWTDLRNRLDADRRCFAFFHPRLPEEPLIFVEVALEPALAENIQTILDEKAPLANLEKARWAIFYSISNTQPGLRGVSFGNFLLKRVIDAVARSSPQIHRFATLSPIPGFARWLAAQDEAALAALLGPRRMRRYSGIAELPVPLDGRSLSAWLLANSEFEGASPLQREIALCAAAHYLSETENGGLNDPVARFHLGNGASIEALHWAADTSQKGRQQSFGMMVNYRYRPEDLDANVARLARGEVVMSRTFVRLL